MTSPGGGTKVEIEDLVRSHGGEALKAELVALGHTPDARRRIQCPFPGCAHKGVKRPRDAEFFPKGHPRVHCFACDEKGDLIDFLQLGRGLSRADAIAHLRGLSTSPMPAPQLRVVPSAPVDDPDKLKPSQVLQIWNAMAAEDAEGKAYLEKRGLQEAVELGLVRFATEQHPDKGVKVQARKAYRVAALLSDVVGNARGIQIRAVQQKLVKDPKIISVRGSVTSRAFFGHPERIEQEPIAAIAEGLADTLALAAWVGDHPVAVAGAAGKASLPRLAEELEAHGVPLEGKYFALFVQNDDAPNGSRKEFKRLSQLLIQQGGRVVFVSTPKAFKDVAQWRQSVPDGEWPPPEIRKAVLPEPGEDAEEEASRPVLAPGTAVPIPRVIERENYAQDFTTLCALLDDPGSRADIMGGSGELTWCEMAQRPRFAGRLFGDTDYLAIRLGLEAQTQTNGKPLKFSVDDISQAVTLLSRRKTVHPVRQWVESITWDERHRLDTDLPQLLGHVAGGLDGVLLKRWIISAVARVMDPGCKAENALVLVGPQGVGKSTFFEVLGGEWFTRDRVLVDDKDSKLLLRRAWIVEWSEMEALKRARDLEAVKTFLSQSVDMYRPPYGREVIEVLRSSIFGGTTNNPEYLSSDPSGYRRFWTVQVSGRIDVRWLRESRAQLFAEALALYRGGEQWHLTPAEDAELAERNKEFETRHPWHDIVEDHLQGGLLAEVTTAEILKEAVGKDADTWSQADAIAVARILTALGWRAEGRAVYAGRLRRKYVRS